MSKTNYTLEDYKTYRSQYLWAFVTFIICLTLGITMGIVIIPSHIEIAVIGWCFLLALIPIELLWMKPAKKKEKVSYKEVFIRTPLSKTFDLISFNPDEGFSKERTYATHLFLPGNEYASEDYIKASYKNIPFEYSDVTIKNVVSTGKTVITYTYFNGQWLILNNPRPIATNFQIRTKDLTYADKKKGNEHHGEITRYHKIETENTQFNQTFQIFADNDHDVFYFLTPQMMERITAFYKYFKVPFTIGCFNNKLHICLHTNKDSFEASGTDTPTPQFEEQHMQQWTKQIKAVIDLLTDS